MCALKLLLSLIAVAGILACWIIPVAGILAIADVHVVYRVNVNQSILC
jgi:hypothetical protein